MAPRLLIISALLFAACGGPLDGDETDDITSSRTLVSLHNAPFPGHPTALIYAGKGFRADGPLNLLVHFHGWDNCIENDVEAHGTSCTPGAPARTAHDLIGQLDRSGANAVLVAVERAYDQATSADGRLAEAGLFRAMILELLPSISTLAGRTYGEADIGKIVLSSHSGGYQAVAHVLDRGGMTAKIWEVMLFDSLYGNTAQYDAWTRATLSQRRLAIIYTGGGGTLANAQAMAARAHGWVSSAGLASSTILDDRTTQTLPDAAFDVPLLFKRSGLSHDGTAQYYFAKLLAHAHL